MKPPRPPTPVEIYEGRVAQGFLGWIEKGLLEEDAKCEAWIMKRTTEGTLKERCQRLVDIGTIYKVTQRLKK